MAAVVLLTVSVFFITFFMWKLTVFTEMPIICPISHDDFPFAVHRMHSFSLGERVGISPMPLIRRCSIVSAPQLFAQEGVTGPQAAGF
ncbi:hypothetical protein X769_28565 [Mesorhizobium sp. LSJC268A00]|nr:hypothetical protein X769_28565 [Mesorhizobium sp. LSJC268A00]